MGAMLLSLMIVFPLAGAILLWVLPAGRTSGRVALVWSLLGLILVGLVAKEALSGDQLARGGFVLESKLPWLSGATGSSIASRVEISYHLGIDGISLWLIVLAGLLSPLVIAASFTAIQERVREYYTLLLLLQSGMLGVFCALDLLLFYVFFEFTLIPLFLLIGIWGSKDKRRAAYKFFIYTVAGSVLTFAGILYYAYYAHAHGGLPMLTFDLPMLYQAAGSIPAGVQWWLFIALAAGFAIKVPLFPFHTWLPLAHTEAPTAGSVLLAGVLLKLGTYGFLRLSLPLLPLASVALAPTMAVLAIIGIIYGAMVAWAQQDMKKLVAYSSVSHLGFCILGMFSLKMAGVSGSVLYMINHGLSTGALFLMVGMIYERYHTRQMGQVGGLARTMPWLAFFFIFFTLSSIGLPGLNGFVGEFLVLLGTALSAGTQDDLAAGPLGFSYAVFAASGILLGAIYMLWLCRAVLFGPLRQPDHTPDTSRGLTTDLTRREITILVPLAIACLWVGVYPKSLQQSINQSVASNILHHQQTQAAAMGNVISPGDRQVVWQTVHGYSAVEAGDQP
ncbi:MAG: NADH-quinone oxidoreductase subunit M [Phycisphaerae bacterium]|nr:NADH-quinone oxidoreductase subunit M [Phycisphaerae bacterium]